MQMTSLTLHNRTPEAEQAFIANNKNSRRRDRDYMGISTIPANLSPQALLEAECQLFADVYRVTDSVPPLASSGALGRCPDVPT